MSTPPDWLPGARVETGQSPPSARRESCETSPVIRRMLLFRCLDSSAHNHRTYEVMISMGVADAITRSGIFRGHTLAQSRVRTGMRSKASLSLDTLGSNKPQLFAVH